jgi:hypothetical protein
MPRLRAIESPQNNSARSLSTPLGWTTRPHEADLLRSIGRNTDADWPLRCTLPPKLVRELEETASKRSSELRAVDATDARRTTNCRDCQRPVTHPWRLGRSRQMNAAGARRRARPARIGGTEKRSFDRTPWGQGRRTRVCDDQIVHMLRRATTSPPRTHAEPPTNSRTAASRIGKSPL